MRSSALFLAVTLLVGTLLAGAAAPPPAAADIVTDNDGRPVETLDSSRMVVAGGALTEIAYRLGAGDRIVAIDTTSLYPPEAQKEKASVGYMRALSAEGVLSVRPPLVVVDADAGPPAALKQIRAAGTALVVLRAEPSAEGAVYKIRAMAALLGLREKGEALADRYTRDMAAMDAWRASLSHRPRVLFVLTTSRGAALVGGRNTSADAIIALAGGVNAIDGYEGYKPLSPEAAIGSRPDVILTTTRTTELGGGEEAIRKRRELAPTPAGRSGRIVAMNGLYLLGFGPRTPEAARDLGRALHPDTPPPALEGVDGGKR